MTLTQSLGPVALEAIALLLLSRLLFAAVIASVADRRGKGLLLGLLRLPGNAVHEFSHCLGFWLCGYRVRRCLLCVFDPRGRGSCSPGRPWSPITIPRLAVGLSALMPLLVGSVVLIVVGRLLGVLPTQLPPAPEPSLLPEVWRGALTLLHGLDPHQWQTYLFVYLALSIGAELSPSSTDLRHALPTILGLILAIWLFFFTLGHAEALQPYRPGLLQALDAGLVHLGSVLAVSLVVTAAALLVGLLPGLALQALRAK